MRHTITSPGFRRTIGGLLLALAATLVFAAGAGAVALPGQAAPNFTKNQLDSPSFGLTTPRSLTDYLGKVVVLFELGHTCPVCRANAPSVEIDIWQHYQNMHPGQVQVIGVDLYNGTQSELRTFKNLPPGTTYPLLLNGGTATGGDLNTLYGPFDNFVVINKTGTVRYNSVNYAHGNRYHLNEIRGCVDSLVMSEPLDVSGASLRGADLRSLPNPFQASTTVEFTNPRAGSAHARVTVHDLQGRRVVTLWDSPAPQGVTRVTWDGRDERGLSAAPGVYVLRGEVGGVTLSRRVTRLR